MLESSGSIDETEGHNQPLKRTIAHAEHGFPFITFADADKVVSMVEVNLGIDLGTARRVKKVGNEQKGVTVFLGDLVETSEVDTEMKRTIFFTNKDNGGSMGGGRRMDDTIGQVLIEKLVEHFKLNRGQRIYNT